MGSKYRGRIGQGGSAAKLILLAVVGSLALTLIYVVTSVVYTNEQITETVTTVEEELPQTNANLRKNVYPPVNPTNPEALLNPSLATETAPETFTVEFQVSRRGLFRANCHREWAPKGADRFYNLVRIGFYDDTYIFRSIRNFMMQFGISSDPQVANAWKSASITDDKNAGISNKKGYLTFAHAGPNTRTTQIFINFKDNAFLDRQSFTPLCQVTDMHTPLRVRITGEGAPQGPGPSQEQLQRLGGTYIKERYPDIDRIISARLL